LIDCDPGENHSLPLTVIKYNYNYSAIDLSITCPFALLSRKLNITFYSTVTAERRHGLWREKKSSSSYEMG